MMKKSLLSILAYGLLTIVVTITLLFHTQVQVFISAQASKLNQAQSSFSVAKVFMAPIESFGKLSSLYDLDPNSAMAPNYSVHNGVRLSTNTRPANVNVASSRHPEQMTYVALKNNLSKLKITQVQYMGQSGDRGQLSNYGFNLENIGGDLDYPSLRLHFASGANNPNNPSNSSNQAQHQLIVPADRYNHGVRLSQTERASVAVENTGAWQLQAIEVFYPEIPQ